MTALNDGLPWPEALLVAAVVAAAAYWLGYRHGSRRHPEAPPEPPPVSVHIPAYRVNELAVLLELGVLTPEEFEEEKEKLHAGRPVG